MTLLKGLKVEFRLEEWFSHNLLWPPSKHHTVEQIHLLTPGQEVSLGVPSCLKIRNSSSISESPGKSGWRFTCDKLGELKNAQFICVSRRYHLHKNAAQTPCIHCSSVKLGAKKDLWCPVMRYTSMCTMESETGYLIMRRHTCTRGWPLHGCSSWQEHWRPLPSQNLPAWSHPLSSPTSSAASSPCVSSSVSIGAIRM